MDKYDSLYEIFGGNVKKIIEGLSKSSMDKLEEIRLRTGKPLSVSKGGESLFLNVYGELSKSRKDAYIITSKDLVEALSLISGYSIYAFEEELKNGYITIRGGHRIGICGKAVLEGGAIKTLKNISSLNVRVTHEIKGCANKVMHHIIKGGEIRHTIIVSPPKCGKTTLLRDIVRQLSDGVSNLNFKGADVGLVDERSEIAGSYIGVPQNDIGVRTDVLDCCPKAEGMQMLLRSMSPQVVAVDEIGKKEDIYAIEEILNAGIKLICTVHGNGIEDITKKPALSELIERRLFETIIVLKGTSGAGAIEGIYDGQLKRREPT